ncbi:MmgE/PrpD family protein [Chloroflexota bacterium]
MMNVMETLVRFATETKFGDLPEDVVHETKRILLDSLGSALGGLSIDKGKIAVEFARRCGGPSEASIIGTGDRISYFGAAFANGELIQAIDYDPVIFPAIHVTPFVLAAPLALAEGNHTSGKEFIRAAAIAIETSVRFAMAFRKVREISDESDTHKPATGYSWNVFGGTAASGLVLGLDPNKIANALGIAGVISPVNAREQFASSVPMAMTKHLMAGWMCGSEITAALLAEMGYIGDTAVLDGENGYWKFSGYGQWEPDAITDGLGKIWHFVAGTNYKIYPCCGILRTCLDCFIDIINKNNIKPGDIEKIKVYEDPSCTRPPWQNKDIKTSVDAQFSVAYTFSVAAHGVEVGPEWQDLGTMQNASILRLMEKITAEPHPDYMKVHREDPTSKLGKVLVVAKGKTFSEERRHFKGDSDPEEFRLKDDDIAEKFRQQSCKILLPEKVDRAVDSILSLESESDICNVMKSITL